MKHELIEPRWPAQLKLEIQVRSQKSSFPAAIRPLNEETARRVNGLAAIAKCAPVILTWGAWFASLQRGAANRETARARDWRFDWITATVALGAVLAIATELLSLMRLLTPAIVTGFWWLAAIGSWARFVVKPGERARPPHGSLRQAMNEAWNRLALPARAILATITVIVLLLLALALGTPSTNWDSLTYHLPRVMHWIQQSGVDHYATGNSRQLEFGPWGGFAITHLMLLSGSDHPANLVQWFAMLTTVIGGSFIAEQLWMATRPSALAHAPTPAPAHNGPQTLNLFAALLIVTLPIGLVQAITTQTDYLTASWLTCFVAALLKLIRQPRDWQPLIVAALGVALGVLSKATMYIFLAPAAVFVGFWWVRKLAGWQLRIRWLATFSLALLILNAGHWTRNLGVFGSPLGSKHIFAIERNAEFSVPAVLSNVIRNLTLHSNTGFEPATTYINQALLGLLALTGRPAQDPATTYHIGPFEVRNHSVISDSYAGCFYHGLLVLIALTTVVARRTFRGPIAYYFGGVLFSFVLFCGYVRWSFWHSRIHLAYLALLMPWVACCFQAASVRRSLLGVAAAVVVAFAGYTLTVNRSRPMFDLAFLSTPREFQYLKTYNPVGLEQVIQCAKDVVRSGAKVVGLKLGFDDAEYPLWVLLRQAGFRGTLYHFNVKNESARLSSAAPAPDLVLASEPPDPAALEPYPFRLAYGEITVYWSEPATHWAGFAHFDPDLYLPIELKPGPQRIRFQRRILTFYVRSPRAGMISLAGTFGTSSGILSRGTIRLNRGQTILEQQTLTGGPARFTFAVPGGTSVITLALLEPPGAETVFLDLTEWQWKPIPQ